jgi:hypothetical protein
LLWRGTPLKKVPNAAPDRWEQIAKLVPGRSKKACMLRVKAVIEQQKAALLVGPAKWEDGE